MMQNHLKMVVPTKLPFLKAICWDLSDVHVLAVDEMLSRYERGWHYRGVVADLKGSEKCFVAQLAEAKGSWLQLYV